MLVDVPEKDELGGGVVLSALRDGANVPPAKAPGVAVGPLVGGRAGLLSLEESSDSAAKAAGAAMAGGLETDLG